MDFNQETIETHEHFLSVCNVAVLISGQSK